MEEKDEIIISLSDVWNIIKKNAAFIIVVTLICAIGSFFITRYFIPKLYTSSIQLYSGSCQIQNKFFITNFVNQEPVGGNVTFPTTGIISD